MKSLIRPSMFRFTKMEFKSHFSRRKLDTTLII